MAMSGSSMNEPHVWNQDETMMECPVCRSETLTLWMGGRLGMIYYCKSCGYKGPVTLEMKQDVS